ECVEKLQLLSSPDERARKLQEMPEVIADPNVDPDYDSDDKEDKLKGSNRGIDSNQWNNSKGVRDTVQQIPGNTWDNKISSTSLCGQSGWKRGHSITQSHGWCHDQHENNDQNNNIASWNLGKDKAGDEQSSGWDFQKSCVKMDDENNNEKSSGERNNCGSNWSGSYAGSGSMDLSLEGQQEKDQTHKLTIIAEHLTKSELMEEVSETGKAWHYKDPAGTIQGPFSMSQLRKWNMKGFFPIDLRIWRSHDVQEDSILLTDAVAGNFQKRLNNWEANRHSDQSFSGNRAVMIKEVPGTGWTGNGASTWMSSEQNNISNRSNQKLDSGLVSSANASKFMKNLNHEPAGRDSSIDISQPGTSANAGWGMPQSSGHAWATVEAPISTKEGLNGVNSSSEWMDPLAVEAPKSINPCWDAGSSEVWGKSKSSEGTSSAPLTIENFKPSEGWGGGSNEGSAVLQNSTSIRSSSSIVDASNSGRGSWVGGHFEGWGAPQCSGSQWKTPTLLPESSKSTNTAWLGGGNDGRYRSHYSETRLSTDTALGGSQISEAHMLRNAGWDGGPTKGWVGNHCTDGSWKMPSVVPVEVPKCTDAGWSCPKSSENMLSATLAVESPKSTKDGWGTRQSSETLLRTVSVAEASKSTNERWGAPLSSEHLWPTASEVEPSKFTNEGWGVPQSSDKSRTASMTVQALEPTSEGWGGSTPGEGWNQSGRTENIERLAGTEPKSCHKSYHDLDSVGNSHNRPPHDGFRPSRNSKKDIP
ncbi:hypothetical protein KI387_029947, partial [Taxus chinensis]